jgi:hypothetical protein
VRDVWHSIAYWLGLTAPDSAPYLFWSGFGGCIRDIVVVVVLVRMWERRRRWLDDEQRRGKWWWRNPPQL